MSAEVYSFTLKFNQLLLAGYVAHLNKNAYDGNASVGLKLNLGQQLKNDLSLNQCFKKVSPSRCKSREKRAADRNQHESMKDIITEEEVDNTLLNTDSRAASNLVNCGCQCSGLTFMDRNYNVHGNCKR